jgi:DNA uptake protein ComE-like DNA-binding protein
MLTLNLACLALAGLSLVAQEVPDKPVRDASSPAPAVVKPKAEAKGKAKSKKDAQATAEAKAKAEAKTRSSAAWKAKAADYARRVDLNAAGREDLKKVQGITDAVADKIIAGRPYLSKAHLVTHNIIPMSLYLTLKDKVKVETKPGTTAGPAKQ